VVSSLSPRHLIGGVVGVVTPAYLIWRTRWTCSRLCCTFPIFPEIDKKELELDRARALGPRPQPLTEKMRRAPATRLEPLHHVLCAARPRRPSRSARRRRSPGYSLSVSTHLACRVGKLSPSSPCHFHNRHFLGRVLLMARLIVQASRVRGAATQACPDPDKTEFDVTHFRQNSSIKFAISATSIGDGINAAANVLVNTMANVRYPSSFIVRGARRCALSSTEVQFHRWVGFKTGFMATPILLPAQQVPFSRCHRHSGSISRQ